MPERAGLIAGDCDECHHEIAAHGDTTGCSECRCPFYRSDLLPATAEQRAEFDRNRYKGRA